MRARLAPKHLRGAQRPHHAGGLVGMLATGDHHGLIPALDVGTEHRPSLPRLDGVGFAADTCHLVRDPPERQRAIDLVQRQTRAVRPCRGDRRKGLRLHPYPRRSSTRRTSGTIWPGCSPRLPSGRPGVPLENLQQAEMQILVQGLDRAQHLVLVRQLAFDAGISTRISRRSKYGSLPPLAWLRTASTISSNARENSVGRASSISIPSVSPLDAHPAGGREIDDTRMIFGDAVRGEDARRSTRPPAYFSVTW